MHTDAEITDLRIRHFAVNFDDLTISSATARRTSSIRCFVTPTVTAYLPLISTSETVPSLVSITSEPIRPRTGLPNRKSGLFSIVSPQVPLSFTLRLPITIRNHPVFHVSQLWPEQPKTFKDREQITNIAPHRRQSSKLSYHDNQVEYPISDILFDRLDPCRHLRRAFLSIPPRGLGRKGGILLGFHPLCEYSPIILPTTLQLDLERQHIHPWPY